MQSIINKRHYGAVVQSMGYRARQGGFVAFVFSSLTLDKVLDLSKSQFSHLQNGYEKIWGSDFLVSKYYLKKQCK